MGENANADCVHCSEDAFNVAFSVREMPFQLSLPMFDTAPAHAKYAAADAEQRGAVFTKHEVVEFILDLAGYSEDAPLSTYRILEPSFGEGDFLTEIVERLLKSVPASALKKDNIVGIMAPCIRAVEVHEASLRKTRSLLSALMVGRGVSIKNAELLLDEWIVLGDFLLVDIPGGFTHVVGNPPYLRQEAIPTELLNLYRKRYSTMYDRADLYVPFIERGLRELIPGGKLCFICSDRWMKNKYGQVLRSMVARDYHLDCYVDMVDTPAFHSDVVAYPAITLISKEKKQKRTRITHQPELTSSNLKKLARELRSGLNSILPGIVDVEGVVNGSQPWLLHSFDQLSIVRRLEKQFPSLEETGCKVGIGVATGADRIYIDTMNTLPVEEDRVLPLVTTKDIESGVIRWRGLGVINPFCDDGGLVDLKEYPRLKAYFAKHREALKQRNCAKNQPLRWYRTIDRIHPVLRSTPKLLIPDIKGEANIVYDSGEYYPHHNIYYITSRDWDLRALQTVLRSGIAKLFVSTYSTQMRGGYLRFQAQYLRRIRLPIWRDVSVSLQKKLSHAAEVDDFEDGQQAVFDLYSLSAAERAAIGGNGKE